ncbi:hypothetical protein [Thalassospira sp. MIT1370]|jgi:hypothetical protein|uniref:hypothetical protein n=1 Tax=unclassified Thalassospira TaxID=2648997 RepID=UPI00399A56F8
MMNWDFKELEDFSRNVNLVLILDHGGRAGSNFFQCIFDKKADFVVSPLIHYVYSYWHRVFGGRNCVSAKEGHAFVSEISYSRLLYQDPVADIGRLIYKIGGDVSAPFDRVSFRKLIDSIFEGRESVTRKQVILWTYAAYAMVRGYRLSGVKLIGINDAVSLSSENMLIGFSGVVIDNAAEDFPQLINLALVRDPRAQYASTRHQMLNEFGNNYAIKPGNWLASLVKLYSEKFSLEHGPAHFCSFYQYATFKALMKKCKSSKGRWYFIKNEDINCSFLPTMTALCNVLGISVHPEWIEQGDNYRVTMLGRPWAGTGAYNSRYQQVVDGPIANDSDEMSAKATGPNRYVTERWRKRIPSSEISILNCLFFEEISKFGYGEGGEPKFQPKGLPILSLWSFCAGEFPGRDWLFTKGKIVARLYYLMAFWPFYFLSRIKLNKFYKQERFFSGLGSDSFDLIFISDKWNN